MPLRGPCGKLSVKPEFGEARSMDHWRKAARREQNQPEEEAVGATIMSSTVEAEPPKPFGVHNLPEVTRDAGSVTVGFNVCSAGFWSCFGPMPLYPPHL